MNITLQLTPYSALFTVLAQCTPLTRRRQLHSHAEVSGRFRERYRDKTTALPLVKVLVVKQLRL